MMVPIMIPAFKNSKIWMFSITPVVCFMSYVGYFLFNFFRKRIQSLNIAKLEYKQLKTITVEKLLERYPDYFIFADYVYLLDGLLATHPGGSHLI